MANPNAGIYCEVKSASEDGGFSGILSTYGNVDLVGDIVEPGAYDADVEMNGTHRPLLWQHDSGDPIGSFNIVSTQDALLIDGSFDLNTRRGAEAHSLLRKGHVNGLSIGYNVIEYHYDDKGIRHLDVVQLLEGSFVTFPANTLARAVAKSRRLEDMSVYAQMKSLEDISEAKRKEILAELDAYYAGKKAKELEELDTDKGKDKTCSTEEEEKFDPENCGEVVETDENGNAIGSAKADDTADDESAENGQDEEDMKTALAAIRSVIDTVKI